MKKIFAFIAVISMSSILSAQVTFEYTGSQQFFVVPACVDSVMVDVIGAEGGFGPAGCSTGTFKYGGKGGRVQATIPVTSGDTLFIFVGGKGEDDNLSSAQGGYNGGGDAEADSMLTYYGGGGGGGASDIRLNGTTLSDRIVVAGGGGGAGADGCNCEPLYGGDGGDVNGAAGEPGALCVCNPSGLGGTQSAGGAKGDWSCGCDAQDGSLGQGGNSNSSPCGGPTGGGGGGGGYYGGGGGGLGAGGGGSSYTFSAAGNVTHTQGYQTGDGQIVITAVGGLSLSVSAVPNDSVCKGTEVTLTASGADSIYWDSGIQNGVSFIASTSTIYTVIGIDSACTDTMQFHLVVSLPPVADFSISGPDTLCSVSGNISLSGSPAGGTFNGPGVTGNNFDPSSADIDAWNVISYSGTDIYGCNFFAQDSIFITVCVGISNVPAGLGQVKVYPNPGDGNYTIETPVSGAITIYNMLGEAILTQQLTECRNQVSLAKEADGIYTLKFIGNGVHVIRLVKE